MVSRTATALILLTLVAMAAPAMADDWPPAPIPDGVGLPGAPCNVLNIDPTFPFVDAHPECIS